MESIEPIPDETERLATQVLDGAFAVHRALGPGLLEGVYETCLCHELSKRGIQHQRQVAMPIVYDGISLETGLRLDILVDNCLIVELKAVEKTIPLYAAQLLTYLKLTHIRLGLLINFNVPVLKGGIRRIAL